MDSLELSDLPDTQGLQNEMYLLYQKIDVSSI
jgi:hypothetical protein